VVAAPGGGVIGTGTSVASVSCSRTLAGETLLPDATRVETAEDQVGPEPRLHRHPSIRAQPTAIK
jgi:hypothetical protein